METKTYSALTTQILLAGIENFIFMVPMRPVQSVFGLFAYTSSDDPEVLVPCKIDEKKYKVSQDYKITLKSIYNHFGKKDFYISDLRLLIQDGVVQMYAKPETGYSTKTLKEKYLQFMATHYAYESDVAKLYFDAALEDFDKFLAWLQDGVKQKMRR